MCIGSKKIPGRGTRDKIANIHWIIEKARKFQKKYLFLLLECTVLTVNPNGNYGLGVMVMCLHRLIDYSKCTPLVRGVDNGAGGSAGKESTCNVGDLGLIPGLGRSRGEGNGYPLQ